MENSGAAIQSEKPALQEHFSAILSLDPIEIGLDPYGSREGNELAVGDVEIDGDVADARCRVSEAVVAQQAHH